MVIENKTVPLNPLVQGKFLNIGRVLLCKFKEMFKVVKFDFFFFCVLNRPSSISSCFSVCSVYNMVCFAVQSRFVYLKEKLEKKKENY